MDGSVVVRTFPRDTPPAELSETERIAASTVAAAYRDFEDSIATKREKREREKRERERKTENARSRVASALREKEKKEAAAAVSAAVPAAVVKTIVAAGALITAQERWAVEEVCIASDIDAEHEAVRGEKGEKGERKEEGGDGNDEHSDGEGEEEEWECEHCGVGYDTFEEATRCEALH